MNENWGGVCSQKDQADNIKPIVYKRKSRSQPIKTLVNKQTKYVFQEKSLMRKMR